MKSLQIELPDKLAAELDALVQSGWFRSQDELVRLALVEFVRRHWLELLERFQQEDIAWALQQKKVRCKGSGFQKALGTTEWPRGSRVGCDS